ncbi:hypothetical protein AK964_14635 [Clostridium butyricum]|nr:hypothetical protein AK964_14635 [Clostridium butyricum]
MPNTAIYTDNPYLISAHASFSSTANGYRYFYYNKSTNDVCTAWMRSNKTQFPVIVTKNMWLLLVEQLREYIKDRND